MSITGTVLDPSGKAIPNNVVVATDANTGVERKTQSNAKGAYELYDLPVGMLHGMTITRSPNGMRLPKSLRTAEQVFPFRDCEGCQSDLGALE